MSAEPHLHLAHVHASYPTAAGPLPVLEDLTLTVAAGEFVSIVGPSGSGKSTLLHVVGGLVVPDAGTVLLDGRDVSGTRGHISPMPQQPALLPWRSVLDNVLLGQEIAGTRDRTSLAQAHTWLGRVGLDGVADALPRTLSGGMAQRVAFLRALLSPHPLMCLDEPFSALDALTRAEMQRWLLDLWEETRRPVLFVTHNIEEALLLSDTVYALSRRPAHVLERVEVPFARPRVDEVIDSPEFIALRRHLTELLRHSARTPDLVTAAHR